MARASWAVLALALAVLVVASLTPAQAQKKDGQTATRVLQGQVLDGSDNPLPDSIVYLKNAKDLSVKTYIANQQGNYRFNALSPNVDYEVYAEHKGHRSDVKTVSSFDSRKLVTINLRIK